MLRNSGKPEFRGVHDEFQKNPTESISSVNGIMDCRDKPGNDKQGRGLLSEAVGPI
jgi:hypothetical protein